LSLCLSCKACKSECPVQVDMAQYKAEFLAQRYKGRRHPLQHYIFGFADKMARFGSHVPGLTNAILNGPLTSPLIKRIAGVAKQRKLPELAPQPWTKARQLSPYAANLGAPGLDPETWETKKPAPPPQVVVLWPDTWNNYYHPQSLTAAESLLTEAGFRVTTADRHICCGRPLYDFGLLDHARAYLKDVLDRMAPQIDAGLPFVFLEPSCASVFRDELPELFPDNPRARRLRDSVSLLADFLADQAPAFAADRLAGKRILIHGHCHHKAVFGGPKAEVALLRQAGADVQMIEAGCCGMAGPFGFEADKFEVSQTIANQRLLPAIEKASSDTILVADGFSCREQIDQLGHRRAKHFAEALAVDPVTPTPESY
ncbi:MAG TPA: heterodisulfide reductase-related iron-sulfur binding cluster, partial [Terracidiphilus sp.]